ncbi:MAG TPA: hypothetical protein VG142_18825 [Trebonia sp.]|nr:hypothetical protein [Trebonia sp.]
MIQRSPGGQFPALLIRPVTGAQVAQLAVLGRYLSEHPQPPWVTGSVHVWPGFFAARSRDEEQPHRSLDPMPYLGAAVALLIAAEAASQRIPPAAGAQWFGPLSGLHAYILRRWGLGPDEDLSDLPVPDGFKLLFRDWATRQADFVSP